MIPGNGLIKLSALALYRRIFITHLGSPFDIVLISSMVIIGLWTVGFFFATIFGCGTHVDYNWAPLGILGSCNVNTRLDGLMISDLITDVLVWLMPIPSVRLLPL